MRSCGSGEAGKALDVSNACPKCGGDEWIFSMDKDGVKRAAPCTCREQAVMSRKLRFAEIPDAFQGMELQTFRIGVYQDA